MFRAGDSVEVERADGWYAGVVEESDGSPDSGLITVRIGSQPPTTFDTDILPNAVRPTPTATGNSGH